MFNHFSYSSLTSVLYHLTEFSERIRRCVEYHDNIENTESIISVSGIRLLQTYRAHYDIFL